MQRPDKLQAFLEAVRNAFDQSSCISPSAQVTANDLFREIELVVSTQVEPSENKLPVCEYFNAAIEDARNHGGAIKVLANTIDALSPNLKWEQHKSVMNEGDDFSGRHANALVIGKGGFEERDDVRIGITLLAPNTTYPDHRHPPSEVYISLSDGQWKQGIKGEFYSPGIGGCIYNSSNVIHGMRSQQKPMLTVWCLLGKGDY